MAINKEIGLISGKGVIRSKPKILQKTKSHNKLSYLIKISLIF